MKRLFVSQPMRGKTDKEILAVREKAIESTKEYLGEPAEVIDSFFQNAPANARPLWYLGKLLELLATTDVVYFAPEWETARGCGIENTCTTEYGIDVIEDYAECIECLVSFGKVIEALKTGCKMTRKGWNEKGQYIQLMTNISYLDVDGNAVSAEHGAIGSKAIAFVGTPGVQMDQLALQADMSVKDWKVVE